MVPSQLLQMEVCVKVPDPCSCLEAQIWSGILFILIFSAEGKTTPSVPKCVSNLESSPVPCFYFDPQTSAIREVV